MAELVKPETFEIDRSKWLRGVCINGISKMLDNAGNMCCLGFYAKACGTQDADMRGYPTPAVVADIPLMIFVRPGIISMRVNTSLARSLMYTNDNTQCTEVEREQTVAETFAKVGVKVTFVGEGKPIGR